MIRLKKLYKNYTISNRPLHALSDINLSIEAGEIFGVFGESGAGKSTLLRTMNLLERPSAGHVYINDVDLTLLNSKELKEKRRHIGMIFQHFNLLSSRNAYENIALPLELIGQSKANIHKEVVDLLELVHLVKHQHHYPSQLSGGQKQRIAIARALATKPDILLCDEATSALDPKSTHSILKLLKEINHRLGVTIVLITHEMDVIKKICDRACVLDQGKLIEQGTIIELFTKPQCEMTKQLVQKTQHIELSSSLKKTLLAKTSLGHSKLIRLTFVGEDSNQPLITTLIQRFNITINILEAHIDTIQDTTIGYTVCQISGSPDAIDSALAYVNSTTVTAEIIDYD